MSAPDDGAQDSDHGDLDQDPLAAREAAGPQSLLPALRGRVHRHHLPGLRLQELVLGRQGDRVQTPGRGHHTGDEYKREKS